MGSPRRERARRGQRRVCALIFGAATKIMPCGTRFRSNLDFRGAALTIALSNPRARGSRQPPARWWFFLVGSFLRPSPAGGGGLAEELWGHLGASARASARGGASGIRPPGDSARARKRAEEGPARGRIWSAWGSG